MARKHNCEKAAPPGFLLSGYRQHGEHWQCVCGKIWVHICDEAEETDPIHRRGCLMPEREEAAEKVEALSAELHAIYQKEARRQAGTGEDAVRHPDDYDALPEHTKEYDRVLARFILAREAASEARYREVAAAAKDLITMLHGNGKVRAGYLREHEVAATRLRSALAALSENGEEANG